MRFPPHILDEIRARLPVSEVVGRRVRLKKAGREWRGLSPFNAEKSPSFFVNDQKGFYHCFSSGQHGDVFTFLMETEGLSFPEAVERLASEAGVALPVPSAEGRVSEARHRSALDVMELAAAWFEDALKGREGAGARDYLAGRGLGAEARERFRIGYAPPSRHGLRDHLAGKDVPVEAMVELGLLIGGEEVTVPYDRFRDRVMFPIHDARGRVIAFGGRALAKEVAAKYLNSPETPLFHKGSVLYNHHNAKKAAHDRGTVIAVEGYVDAVSMTMAGHPNVVAPLGTALTEDQLGLLWRMAPEPILCFDGDKAGRKAAYRALDVALPALEAGRSLRFALLPEGQDPDDLARSGGPGALDRVLAGAKPLVDVLWTRETTAGPMETPEQRAGLADRLRRAVDTIRAEGLRRFYRDEVRRRLDTLSPWAQRAERRPGGRGRGGPPRGSRTGWVEEGKRLRIPAGTPALLAGTNRFDGGTPDQEALIVALLLAHPEFLGAEAEALADLDFTASETRALRDLLLDEAAQGGEHDAGVVRARVDRAGLGPTADRLAARTGADRRALAVHADPARVANTLRQAMTLHRKSRTLHSELRAAQRDFTAETSDAYIERVRDVQDQIFSVAGIEADADSESDVLPSIEAVRDGG